MPSATASGKIKDVRIELAGVLNTMGAPPKALALRTRPLDYGPPGEASHEKSLALRARPPDCAKMLLIKNLKKLDFTFGFRHWLQLQRAYVAGARARDHVRRKA